MHRAKFYLKNWKLGIHLLFRTKRFGVNNRWYWHYDSLFGWSTGKKIISALLIYPIVGNYKMMKFRSKHCHFLSDKSYEECFGEKKNAQS